MYVNTKSGNEATLEVLGMPGDPSDSMSSDQFPKDFKLDFVAHTILLFT